MMTFKNFFQNKTVKFFIVVFVLLLFVVNFAFYLISILTYQEERQRQQDGYMEMMVHLVQMENVETAITYSEHFYHTQGVEVAFIDIEGGVLYQSMENFQMEDAMDLVDSNLVLLGKIIYNDASSFGAVDFQYKLLYLNIVSVVLLFVVVMLLKHYVHGWYQLLSEDLRNIGTKEHTFQFHDLEAVNEKMLTLFEKEKQMRDYQLKTTKALAHDLRTPLTVIKAYIEGVQLGKVDLTKEVVQDINHEIDQIEKMIPQLMKESKELESQEVDIKVCIEEISNRMTQAFSLKEIQVKQDLESLRIRGTKEDMVRMIENLLLNAYLYTPKQGKITIAIHSQSRNLIIQDSGVGMTKEELHKVKMGIFRSKEAIEMNPKGTGKGLQIVEEIASKYGFKLEISSKKYLGTTVVVSFS